MRWIMSSYTQRHRRRIACRARYIGGIKTVGNVVNAYLSVSPCAT